jgi:plasmid stabilization system protein ParE
MQVVNVKVTGNFEHNLESIRCYFHQQHQTEKYQELLDKLFDKIIPNLQSHPMIGFDLLSQTVNTIEEQRQVDIIKTKLAKNTQIRQYNDKDYIVLYTLTNNAKNREIVLLAIKHRQQMVFDLRGIE